MPSLATESAPEHGQIDAFSTPGTVLKAARLSRGISEREAADLLNLMPDYVGILERDDYQALRSPAFARGYVKTYGRMLGIDEEQLLSLYEEVMARGPAQHERRIETRPLQLQSTGVGVVVGLGVLLLLVAALWWWQDDEPQRTSGMDSSDVISFEQVPSVRPSGSTPSGVSK